MPTTLLNEFDVIRCLITYTDWWHLVSASVIQVSARRRQGASDGFSPGLLDTLDERTDLCRKMALLEEKDRHILFLWYVAQLPVREIAAIVGVSGRQCFRRRAKAVRTIVELGKQDDAA